MSSGQKKLVFLFLIVVMASLIYARSRSVAEVPQISVVRAESQAQQSAIEKPAVAKDAALTQKRIRFLKLSEDVKKIIPTQAELQKLTPQQVHYTPEVLQKAAIGVGEIAQLIADNPSLAPEGLQFYRECAEKSDNPTSLRTNCYVSHEQVLKKYGGPNPSLANDPQVDDSIKKLARPLL